MPPVALGHDRAQDREASATARAMPETLHPGYSAKRVMAVMVPEVTVKDKNRADGEEAPTG